MPLVESTQGLTPEELTSASVCRMRLTLAIIATTRGRVTLGGKVPPLYIACSVSCATAVPSEWAMPDQLIVSLSACAEAALREQLQHRLRILRPGAAAIVELVVVIDLAELEVVVEGTQQIELRIRCVAGADE